MSSSAFQTASSKAALGAKSSLQRSAKQKAGSLKAPPCATTDFTSAPATSGHVSRAQSKKLLCSSPHNGQTVSRLDVLLTPRQPRPVFQPQEETPSSARVNEAIKLAGQWTDVEAAVADEAVLSASNIAFAVYRLGCLFSFSSAYRKREIQQSGLAASLLEAAQQKLHRMDAGSVTLLLDGCARLELEPAAGMMTALANLAHSFASSFEASQLPLVLWAFQRLRFVPRGSVLAALDAAAVRVAPLMSAQGVSLTLAGFQAAGYRPSQRALHRLAETMQRQLLQFKPSEAAACIDAFAACDHSLSPALVKAIAQRFGQSVHSNIVTGKPSLSSRAPSTDLGTSTAAARALAIEHGSQIAASQISAAGRALHQVGQRLGELDASLGGTHTLRNV